MSSNQAPALEDADTMSIEQVEKALEAAIERVEDLRALLKSKQTAAFNLQQDERQRIEQPANKKARMAAKSGAAAEKKDQAPDFAMATCAEATWWAPSKVMPGGVVGSRVREAEGRRDFIIICVYSCVPLCLSFMSSYCISALGSYPIGHIKTCFPRKNGCPRQGSVCPSSLAHLDLCFGNNPHHALDGLEVSHPLTQSSLATV